MNDYHQRVLLGDRVQGHGSHGGGMGGGVLLNMHWHWLGHEPRFDRRGRLAEWELVFVEDYDNLIVNQGLNHLLDVHFHAATQITTWYIALLGASGGTINATQTYQNSMSTGNDEVVNYDEAARQAFVEGAPSGQSIDNVGNEAVFTVSSGGLTVGGGALVSDSTKNDNGAGPFMYSKGAFTGGDQTLSEGGTLTVTLTLTAADDGA